MVFKPKFNKGETPCNVCQIGSHSKCKKRQYCSCNCPHEFVPIKHSNQNRKKTHCLRGHEFTLDNTYVSKRGNHRICKACQKFTRNNNQEKIKESAKKCYQKYKNEYRLLRRIGAKNYLAKVKTTVLNYYSQNNLACVCCGESQIKFLTIDHIIPIGTKNKTERGKTGHNMYRYLIKHKFPEGYQTLCFNCNSGRALNKGICPHKTINTIPVFIKNIRISRLVNKTKDGEGQFLN